MAPPPHRVATAAGKRGYEAYWALVRQLGVGAPGDSPRLPLGGTWSCSAAVGLPAGAGGHQSRGRTSGFHHQVRAQPVPILRRAFTSSKNNGAAGTPLSSTAASQKLSSGQGGLLTSRYQALVESGTLRPDPKQASTIQRLQRLAEDLVEYKAHVEAHNLEKAAFEDRKNKRIKELEEQERRKGEPDVQPAQNGGNQYLRGFLRILRGLGIGTASADSTLTPEQLAALAYRRRLKQAEREMGPPPAPPTLPKGVYIYGSVGSGKSLVMDLFHDTISEQRILPYTRRVHFNAAMLEMHSWLTKIDRHMGAANFKGDGGIDHEAIQGIEETFEGQAHQAKDNGRNAVIALRRATRALALNPHQQSERLARSNAAVIRRAARAVIRSHLDLDSLNRSDRGQPITPSLLCFDELQVTDVFAAVALKGMLEVLTSEGTVMVMTSNRAPDDLNSQGLHEDLFDHFVGSLKERCDPVEVASGNDYRKLMYSSQQGSAIKTFHSPLDKGTESAVEKLWSEMVVTGKPRQLNVMFGRQLQVPSACSGTARFSFHELCARPLGAADYIAIAREFHTVFITGIPSFSMQIRDQARRFITLVDELYNHRVRLVCSAQDTPDRLFVTAQAGDEEAILDMMDLEGLQSETAVEGGGLRRDVLADGGVAPVATSQQGMRAVAHHLGGMEEKFAFKRAVSRMYEMQTDVYLNSRARAPSMLRQERQRHSGYSRAR